MVPGSSCEFLSDKHTPEVLGSVQGQMSFVAKTTFCLSLKDWDIVPLKKTKKKTKTFFCLFLPTKRQKHRGRDDLDSRLTVSRCSLLLGLIRKVHISWLRGFFLICCGFQIAVVRPLLSLNLSTDSLGLLALDHCGWNTDNPDIEIDQLIKTGKGGLRSGFWT